MPKRECVECGRVFDLLNEKDAVEWGFGHDCEAKQMKIRKARLTIAVELTWDEEAEEGLTEPQDWLWDDIIANSGLLGVKEVKLIRADQTELVA